MFLNKLKCCIRHAHVACNMSNKQIWVRYGKNPKYVKDVSLVFNLYICLCRRELNKMRKHQKGKNGSSIR